MQGFGFGFGGQDRLASRIVNLFEINNGSRLFGRSALKSQRVLLMDELKLWRTKKPRSQRRNAVSWTLLDHCGRVGGASAGTVARSLNRLASTGLPARVSASASFTKTRGRHSSAWFA
jgi:hypothetical protein